MKRTTEVLPDEIKYQQEKEEEEQISKYKQLVDHLLHLRDNQDANAEELFSCSGELLLMNPDFLTAWNIRRRALRILLTKPE